jgi:hypothetical protein
LERGPETSACTLSGKRKQDLVRRLYVPRIKPLLELLLRGFQHSAGLVHGRLGYSDRRTIAAMSQKIAALFACSFAAERADYHCQ